MAQAETHGTGIDTLLLEERRYLPPPAFAAQANAQADIYERPFDEFWRPSARERVSWFEPFTELLEWEPPYAKWFLGGKLNVCFNCVDRHVEAGNGAKVAYFWEGEPEGDRRELSFSDFQGEVVRFANALKRFGVEKGTPAGIYMGMVPEPADRDAGVRPPARCTPSSSAASRPTRSPGAWNDMECKLLITQDEGWRNHRAAEGERDAALADAATGGEDGRPSHRRRGRDGRRRDVVARRRRGRERRSGHSPVRADGVVATSSTCSTRAGRIMRSRRGSCTRPAATRRHRDHAPLHLRHQARLDLLVRRRHRLGHRAQLHRSWAAPATGRPA